jgi:hypothetical protein
MHPRPPAFVFLSACFFLCACAMALGLADGELASGPASRFVLAATGALALVTAEALAFVRRWAFSASLAFAASFAATTFVLASSNDAGSNNAIIAIAAIAAFPIVTALVFIYNGLRSVPAATPGPRRIRVP